MDYTAQTTMGTLTSSNLQLDSSFSTVYYRLPSKLMKYWTASELELILSSTKETEECQRTKIVFIVRMSTIANI